MSVYNMGFGFDDEVSLFGESPKNLLQMLTLDDIEQFLGTLGVVSERRQNYLVCPTICHNSIEDAESMKLYYYDDSKYFHCYTECGTNFNLFELYMKYCAINHTPITFWDAVEYIRRFIYKHGTIIHTPIVEQKLSRLAKARQPIQNIQLPAYDDNVMDVFINHHHSLWLKDNISSEVMDYFQILFSIYRNKIIIPHRDIDGRLVGIRGRAIEEKDLEEGKYRPITVGGILYSHPLGFNLYGLCHNKIGIKKFKRAIIFEGERSIHQHRTIYSSHSTAVATCGSTLNKFQVAMLRKLGVNEIVLAFDKEFEKIGSEEEQQYRRKLVGICQKYSGLANFSYIYDEQNLLRKKESPIDRGQEVFEKLYNKRIAVKN